jgi:hypothetical protein
MYMAYCSIRESEEYTSGVRKCGLRDLPAFTLVPPHCSIAMMTLEAWALILGSESPLTTKCSIMASEDRRLRMVDDPPNPLEEEEDWRA